MGGRANGGRGGAEDCKERKWRGHSPCSMDQMRGAKVEVEVEACVRSFLIHRITTTGLNGLVEF